MRFAKLTFRIAGIWGIAVLAPMYFLFGAVGRQAPPPVTHPEFYFGFVGVGLAWQFVFLVIATDPARYRPIMILSVFEKLSFVIAVAWLFGLHRMTSSQAVIAIPDAILAVFFLLAFRKTATAVRAS